MVSLVGAGPGDPQLITVKGLRRLREADVIVYDRLVPPALLREARPEAEMIFVGKSPGQHAMVQAEINDLLARKAHEGKTVVRLKGGDPFVFGRGGEEAEALAAQGIAFEVVPGVTAATAVPCYAGVPVTQRGVTSCVAIVTGHEDPAKEASSIAWDKIATGADTLVFLMAVENLAQVTEQLVAHGRAPGTPAALVQEGTTPRQKTVVGTLADIVSQAEDSGIQPPAVLLVGEVARMRHSLRWYDNSPLFGRRVLVTRARHQASRLTELLADHGAEPIELPTIHVELLTDYSELDEAVQRLSGYSWVVFTSANGVDAFFGRLAQLALDARSLKDTKVCAIGPATCEALEHRGLIVDYVPREFVSEGIVEGLGEQGVDGKRILLPRAAEARPDLVNGLVGLGALVDEIAVYRTLPTLEIEPETRRMLLHGEIDITTFTSSSTVRNLASMLGSDWEAVDRTTVACIGPITAAVAVECGLRVDIVAEEFNIPGLVRSLVDHYQRSQGG
jgi:uroporphyrinogen III methyltransferase/synthase